MNKDIIEHIAYEKGLNEGLERGKRECNRVIVIKEDLAYEKGLIAGYAKSIVLIRHLERTLSYQSDDLEKRDILDQAMQLIAEKIEPNNV